MHDYTWRLASDSGACACCPDLFGHNRGDNDGTKVWMRDTMLAAGDAPHVILDAIRRYERHTAAAPERECLSCNRPIAEHERHTAADIVETAGATYARPVITSAGWKYFAPLSPTLVGKYRGHDPRPLRAVLA